MKTLKKITVEDAYKLDETPPILVKPEDDLTRVIKEFTEIPELRGIFVVGENNRLVGVITRRDLLDWARSRVGTTSQSRSWLSEDARLIKVLMSSTAGEIIRPDSRRAAVRTKDDLAYALHLMVDLDLICLPVIDESNQIIGDLKLMEILSRVVQMVQEDESIENSPQFSQGEI